MTININSSWRQKGFTLIEGLIAVSVLSFGFLAINKLQGNAIKARSDAMQRSQAAALATAKMEALRKFGTITDYTNLASGSDSPVGKNASYSRSWTITNNTYQKGIDLNISWLTSRNKTMNVRLNSMIAKTDPKLSGQVLAVAGTGLPTPPSVTPTVNPNIPAGAVNNGDGTSDYKPPSSSVVVTFDNTSGSVVKINHTIPYSIAGTITVLKGADSPGKIDLNAITMTISNNINAYCYYSNDGTTGSYTCYVTAAWQGSITLGGMTNVKVCTNTTQPYAKLTANLTNQNYGLFKKTRACAAPTPTQYQLL